MPLPEPRPRWEPSRTVEQHLQILSDKYGVPRDILDAIGDAAYAAGRADLAEEINRRAQVLDNTLAVMRKGLPAGMR